MVKKKSVKEPLPLVQSGDKIYVSKARNNQLLNGQILTVAAGYSKKVRRNSFVAADSSGRQYTIYYSSPSDDFVIATRDTIKGAIKKEILSLKKLVKEKQEEYDRLARFATDEEEVAFKLDQILSAHADSQNSEDRVAAITALLGEMKKTDYI